MFFLNKGLAHSCWSVEIRLKLFGVYGRITKYMPESSMLLWVGAPSCGMCFLSSSSVFFSGLVMPRGSNSSKRVDVVFERFTQPCLRSFGEIALNWCFEFVVCIGTPWFFE